MEHAPEYIEVMRKLAPLIRDVRKFSVWQFDCLCNWFAYHWNHGTIVFRIQDDAARGVCVVKIFDQLEQFLEPFVHDPKGKFVMIEVMSADGAETMGKLHDELVERWGPRPIMLWDRGERTADGAPRMYRWDQFERLSRRITRN
jgi:hypothetical protein